MCYHQDLYDADFKKSAYVQRAVNDIAFCAKKNKDFPVFFQLGDDAFMHVCISEAKTDHAAGCN